MFQKKPSASEVDDVQYRRAKTWQIICYACNAFVGMSVYSLIGMASYSASIGYGITTATVGIILMLARILDGFTDPMLAFIYDRVNTRFGKLRVLLISGYLIEAVGLLCMFNLCSSKGFGLPVFVLTYIIYIIGYTVSNMTIQSAINGFGTVAVAAWSVYGKIDFLFWMTVSSFGIAVTTFAGQNFGARQYDRVRRGTMTCLAMTAGTTLCISLALYPSAQLLFRLFSSDDAVVAQGVQMMHYLVPVYMTYICIEIFSGALRGCGDVRVPTIITVFAVCIMRIVWLAVALPFKHELSVVEFSYPLTWITATVLFAIYYTKGGWMQRCIAAQNAKTQG